VITLPDVSPVALELRSPGRLLLGLAARQRWTLLGAALMGTLWMLAQAGIPLVVGRTLDAGVAGHDGQALAIGCAALIVLGLLTAVAGVLRHRLAVSNWMQAGLRTQQAIGHHVADHGLAVGAQTTTGEVVETVSTDAPRLADLYDIVARGTGALGSYLVVTVLLLRMDLAVGLWVAFGVPALSLTLAGVIRPLQARQSQHREQEGQLTALGADTVAGIRVLRGIGGEDQFLERYRERSQQVRGAGVRVAGLQAGLDSAHVLLPGVFVVVLTWMAAHAALDGRLTPGELVTIYGYAAFLRMPLETATEALSKAVRARVAAARMIAVLSQTDSSLTSARTDSELSPPAGSAVYDPESGLTVSPGLLTAMVTAQPEHAAAIADRLIRLSRPAPKAATAATATATTATTGTSAAEFPVRMPEFGGVRLDELPTDALRHRILLSEAEPRMFTGTLRGELDPYARHPDADLLAALTVADATDVLDALPDGWGSRVEERGLEFSGGQRQRLVLARAVLADPEVLVLVEPTSAVDAHTEARVASRLRAARAGRTTLVATASPLMLDLCDRVVLLVGGRVRAEGTHRELLRESAAYRQVVIRSGQDNEDDDGAGPGGETEDDEVQR
jgi:ABC-type multidrug transport system fused ATPase/permease subunit